MAKGTVKKIALGALIAAIAGYVAGILTAPKSGKETRRDIKDKAVKTTREAEKTLKKLHTQISSLLDEAKLKTTKLSGKAKIELAEASVSAKKTKEKIREILSAIHEGEADDKDLQKAVDEASTAIKHLKSYLSKS